MNNLLLLGTIASKILYGIAFILDEAIYRLAKVAFSVFCFISEITLVNEDMVTKFMSRINAILGIVMIFILAYNLLTYIVDPDKINDSKVGAASVIKDIVIALAIITFLPGLFSKLYAFQNTVITSGVIPNIIVGGFAYEDGSTDDDKGQLARDYIDQSANRMVADVYSAFIFPEDEQLSSLDCIQDENGNLPENVPDYFEQYCDAYQAAVNKGSIHGYGNLIGKKEFRYSPLISTAAGVVLAFFMFSFCVNLGKRAGKLAILELIAPVPVLMEIIPNKKGTRKNWIDSLVQTYLEVFLYQAIVFVVMYLITFIPALINELFRDTLLNSSTGGIFVRLLSMCFLIYGLLQFGKEAPKMVMDLLTSGIGTMATVGTRNVASTVSNVRDARAEAASRGYNLSGREYASLIGRGAGRTLTGAGSGLITGMWNQRSQGFHNLRRNTSSNVANTLDRQRRNSERMDEILAAGREAESQSLTAAGANFGWANNRDRLRAGAAGLRSALGEAINFDDRVDSVRSWATGSSSGSYTAATNRINNMNSIKGYYKDYTDGYAAYDQAVQVLNEAKSHSNYDQIYQLWKRTAPNNANTESDFIAYLSQNGNSFNNQNFTDVVNAYNRQEAVGRQRIESKSDDIINNALQMMNSIELNPSNELSGDVMNAYNDLRQMLDADGNLINSDIHAVNKAAKALRNKLNADILTEQRSIQRQQMEEELRNQRRNSGGNSSGS